MRSDLWQRVEPILDAALDRPSREWPALLDEACGDDTELRAEVEALLRDCAAAEGFLDLADPRLVEARAEPFVDPRHPFPLPEERLGDRLGVYQLAEILGRGGMGTVYLARRVDGLFEQSVAIKLAERRELGFPALERFHYERQILAGLDHPNIARLFDGGVTDDGLPYLVMERVDGEPLDVFCQSADLDPSRRLRLVIDACMAVDHAHRRRVVHLDIKPSNILVAAADGGDARGVVKLLDFGVAELLGAEPGPSPNLDDDSAETNGTGRTGTAAPARRVGDSTASGAAGDDIAGPTPSTVGLTPNFASPEQLTRGTVTSASDIYALGVVLYLLVAGRLPFVRGREEETETFATRVVGEPPPPLADPELNAIAAKALAKEPVDRYASAAALAEDLERFLSGLPLAALPPHPLYVLRKHVARHRLAWGLAALALLAIVLLSFVRWQDARAAEERVRLAGSFASEAERMESFLRYAYSLPEHDVRREKALVDQRMERIAEQVEHLGAAAEAAGHLALGRGHAGLHRFERAIEHLEMAWQAGERSAVAAYSLGRALGEIYSLERRRASQIRDPVVRAQRHADLAERYQARIRTLFEHAASERDETVASDVLAGLAALHAGETERAVELGQQAARATPWLPDGLRLEGEARRALGEEAIGKGEHESAHRELSAATRALEQTARMAPSDPLVAESQCAVQVIRSHMERLRRGDLETPLARGLVDCGRSLELDPDRLEPRLLAATLYLFSIQNPELSVDTRAERLERARELTAEAESLLVPGEESNFERAEIARLQGTVHLSRAVWVDRARGLELAPSLESAAAAFRRSLEADEALVEARVNLGTALAISADEALARGDDPRPLFAAAIESFREAVERAPEQALVLHNLANLGYSTAEYRWSLGEDPSRELERAVDDASRALEINPALPYSLNLRGAVHESLARLAMARGESPEAHFERADRDLAALVEIAPSYLLAWVNRGSLSLSRARWAVRNGLDGRSFAETSLAELERAVEIDPRSDLILFANLAETHLFLASLERQRGQDERASIERARQAIEQGLNLDPDHRVLLDRQARVRLATARRQESTGGGAEAVRTVGAALASLPGVPARLSNGSAEGPATKSTARTSAEPPADLRLRITAAEMHLWLAAWTDEPTDHLELGRAWLGELPSGPAVPLRARALEKIIAGASLDSIEDPWLREDLRPLAEALASRAR